MVQAVQKAPRARQERASTVAAAIAIALCLPRVGAAAGQEPSPGEGPPTTAAIIAGGSVCPTPAAVWSELEPLVPPQRLAEGARELGGDGGLPTILDQGAVYRVTTGGRAREYRDDARACAQRARVAAIFLALSLEPAAAADEMPTPPTSPVATAPARDETRARLELGARFDAGLGPSPADLTGGISFRASVGRGPLVVSGGAGILFPRDVAIGDVPLRQWRAPFDLGLRARRNGRVLAPFVEGGVVIALISEGGKGLATVSTTHAFELGARAAIGFHGTWSSRFAPFATLHAEWIPSPSSVVALPRGVVGHTPRVWLGATAGLFWGQL